jgi:hypothetical protein
LSNSAVRYEGTTRYLKDHELGHLLAECSKLIASIIEDGSDDYEWLALAIEQWWNDYENMPPGLKDIELDDVLISSNRKKQFKKFLDDLVNQISDKNTLLIELNKLRDIVSSVN